MLSDDSRWRCVQWSRLGAIGRSVILKNVSPKFLNNTKNLIQNQETAIKVLPFPPILKEICKINIQARHHHKMLPRGSITNTLSPFQQYFCVQLCFHRLGLNITPTLYVHTFFAFCRVLEECVSWTWTVPRCMTLMTFVNYLSTPTTNHLFYR